MLLKCKVSSVNELRLLIKLVGLLFQENNWASSWETLSSGFATRWDTNRPVQPQKVANIEKGGILVSRQRIRQTLLRLRGCAGWSAFLLFAHDKNRVSHDVAQLYLVCKNGDTSSRVMSKCMTYIRRTDFNSKSAYIFKQILHQTV